MLVWVCIYIIVVVVVQINTMFILLHITERLDITYSKSTGPGGQLVNKVFTKVDLRFHVESAEWLSDEIKRKLLEQVIM